MKIEDIVIGEKYRINDTAYIDNGKNGVCTDKSKYNLVLAIENHEVYLGPQSVNKLIKLPELFLRRFPSGAVRSDDTGRIRPDYISPYALNEIAQHFTDAKNDFGATNYFKGIKPADVLASIQMHYLDLHVSILENQSYVIRKELRALAANCIMALHQIVIEEKGLYKEPYEKTELVNSKDIL